ncbi:hypothetical protein HFN_2123 [Helicobacter fennelliae MRY12-0050]|uniref:Uncharacterized protein n=1 Tax=Helicobacter fennelliae MRY12-0050 TaxID=1325130 RepID=T1D0G4_9HELI|nr:hypothetical protein HFN_2123 [Helicobacter fennelliae MRY12-0050]
MKILCALLCGTYNLYRLFCLSFFLLNISHINDTIRLKRTFIV